MNIWILILTTCLLQYSSSAPDRLQTLEQAMLNQFHKPWFTTDKPPGQGRKGEGCKGGRCAVNEGCDGCQHSVPVKFNKD